LDCIWNEASIKIGLRGINPKQSGIYFEFDENNYLSIHPDEGRRHKFHINQDRKMLELSISYNEDGDLRIIKKYNDQDFWRGVDDKFKRLLDIIEDCVNNFKVKPIPMKPLF
jgi:hypothetical protein